MSKYTRRDILRMAAVGAGTLSLPVGLSGCRPRVVVPTVVEPDFSVAYLTDMHVHAEQGAAEGFAKAVRRALGNGTIGEASPEFFIMGGDQPFDILKTGLEEADAQYGLYDEAMADVQVPVYPVIGNHDILGIDVESPLTADHPKYGKTYFLEHFGLERTYYSFDHEAWHFVILDSVQIQGNAYRGWVEEEQLAWLDDDLGSSGKPTVVVAHIPIFSNYIEYIRGTAELLPSGVSVVNSHEVAAVLGKHDVRLVLGGHLHINETFLYKGTEYSNVGAVSGNWWNGVRDGFEEGYARLDFVGDQVGWSYVDYGWDVEKEEGSA